MWWAIVVLVCLDALSSQQVGDAHALVECCPCPGSERAALGVPGSAAQTTENALLSRTIVALLVKGLISSLPCPENERAPLDALGFSIQTTGNALIGRPTDVDDCPCRVRDADSDGAPSAILPRVLLSLRSDVEPEDKNEDVKPLLHPEVDLASSVLETLRDATEEEYQEALARDAARNAARALEDEPGHQVTDPGNSDIVTIIVNPEAGEEEDVIISEASNVQESRCPYSLSSTKSDLGQVKSTTPLIPTKGLLRLPKFKSKSNLRRPFDVYKSASNVEERVVSANRGLEGLRLKSSPSKLSELLERTKSQIDETKNDFNSPKVPNFRLNSLLKNKNNQTGLNANEKKLKVNLVKHHIFPKINISKERTMLLDRVSDLDSSTSPSNVHEQFLKSLSQKPENNNLKSFLKKDVKTKPTNLKSSLKLKDIELISNKPIKSKINIPTFKITPLLKNVKNTNEPGSIELSCGEEQRSEKSKQKISHNSEQINKLNDATFSSSENCCPLIETERNIHEENISDNIANFEYSAIQADTSNGSVEMNNRNKEVYEKSEDFDLDNESADLGTHEKELESSEREECSASIEMMKNSNELEGIDSVELPREDNLQNEGDNDDLFVDASSKDLHFIFQDYDEEINFQKKKDETNPEKKEIFSELKPFHKDVPTLKEKMLQKLEGLKDDIANIKNAREIYLESADSRDKDKDVTQKPMGNDDKDIQTQNTNLKITTQEFISSTEAHKQTSSLDQLEQNFKSLPKSTELTISSQELNMSVEPLENIRDDGDEDPDMNQSASSSETTILDSVDSVNLPSDSEDNPQITDSALLNGGKNQDINKQQNSNENTLEKTCMADMDKNMGFKTEDSNKPKEMSSQASESIFHVISKPSERQNIVVQPTSLFGENSIFRPLPAVPSLLNLDGHLPTLDEIRSGLSGILGMGPRETDDDDKNSEFQSAEDCSGAMAKGASTTSSKSVFSYRKPLEDINLDIFQLTPKSQKNLYRSRAPGLNLNSYKAKLALPQNLGLKPLRLESSVGKNGNLLGATLTFGPKTIASSKSKMSKPSSIFNHARVPLGSTLPSLPDLDEIKSTMKARTKDLLNSPLSLAPSHTVQKASELTDNLRSHTENTVKNIQQTLASTLSESRVREIPFREKFAKPSPEDLLEKLSTAREDMNDKLKALHIDLADRLSSIHENIAEKTTLPTLQLPLFTQINRNPNPKFKTRPKSSIKSRASISNKRSNQASASNLKSSASRKIDEIKERPFKISKAASTLTPKNVEVPILMTTTSAKPPFAKPLQRDSIIKLKDSRLFESSMTVDKKPTPRNNVKLTKNNPTSQSRPALNHDFGSQRTTLRTTSAKDTLRKKANLGSKLRFDSRGFASEVQPATVLAPLRTSFTERTEPAQTQVSRSKVKPLFSNKDLDIPNQINDQVSRSLIPKPLPKIGDSTLLSKMRKSLLSSHSIKSSSLKNNSDMTRSATENKEIEVRQEPLRENVKYRCRMVCVKEPIE